MFYSVLHSFLVGGKFSWILHKSLYNVLIFKMCLSNINLSNFRMKFWSCFVHTGLFSQWIWHAFVFCVLSPVSVWVKPSWLQLLCSSTLQPDHHGSHTTQRYTFMVIFSELSCFLGTEIGSWFFQFDHKIMIIKTPLRFPFSPFEFLSSKCLVFI